MPGWHPRPGRLVGLVATAALVLVACEPIVSDDVGRNTPFVQDGQVQAIAKVGDIVVVGGNFTEYKGWRGSDPVITDQPYLFAYDHTDGRLVSQFSPDLDGVVNALAAAPDGSGVYVGGEFNKVNGVNNRGVVKLAVPSGERLTAFEATVQGQVTDMDVSGSRLFLTGIFGAVNFFDRTNLAAVDTETGALDKGFDVPLTDFYRFPWGDFELDVTPSGDRLVVTGNFGTVDGQPRSQVAQIDLTTNSVAPWSTPVYPQPTEGNRGTYTRDVAYSPDGSYFVVVTTCCVGDYFDSATRFETGGDAGSLPTWTNHTGYDTLTAVAVTESAVYVGGHQKWQNSSRDNDAVPGSVNRPGIAALDPDTGVALNWNPGRDRGVGVYVMKTFGDGLFIGHDTNMVADRYRPGIAFFPNAGGSFQPADDPVDLPADLWSVDRDSGAVEVRDYDGTSLSARTSVDQTLPGTVSAFVIADRLYTATIDDELLEWSRNGDTWVNPVDVNARDDWAVESPVDWPAVNGAAYTQDALVLHRAGSSETDRVPIATESMLYGYDRTQVSAPDDSGWATTSSQTIVGDQILWVTDAGELWQASQENGQPVAGTQSQLSGPGVDDVDWSTKALFATDA